MAVQAAQELGLAGCPESMNLATLVSRHGGVCVPPFQLGLSTQCALPGTETSRAFGMVALAAATFAGGSVGSAVPFRNKIGSDVRTVPETPGLCGQRGQSVSSKADLETIMGAKSELVSMALGFIAAHASPHSTLIGNDNL